VLDCEDVVDCRSKIEIGLHHVNNVLQFEIVIESQMKSKSMRRRVLVEVEHCLHNDMARVHVKCSNSNLLYGSW
jgi:hypothetical protein